MKTDPQRDEEREALRRPQARDRTRVKRANVRRAGAETHGGTRAPRQPEVVVDEAHQTDGQKHRKDKSEPTKMQPRVSALRRLRERFRDWRDAFGEDIPEKEEAD